MTDNVIGAPRPDLQSSPRRFTRRAQSDVAGRRREMIDRRVKAEVVVGRMPGHDVDQRWGPPHEQQKGASQTASSPTGPTSLR